MAVLTRHESLPAWLVEFLEATPTSIASPRTGSATCAGWLCGLVVKRAMLVDAAEAVKRPEFEYGCCDPRRSSSRG